MSSYWYGYNTDSKFKLGQPAPKRIHMIDAFVPFPYNDVWFDNGFLLPPPRALNRSNVKTGPRSGSRWRKGSEMKELKEQEEELAGYLPYDVDEVQSKKKKKTDEEKKKEHFVDALRQTLRPELLVNVEAAMREPSISVPDEEATTEVEIRPRYNIPTTIAATDDGAGPSNDTDDDDDDDDGAGPSNDMDDDVGQAKIPLPPSGDDTVDEDDDVGSIESVKASEAKKEDAAKTPEVKAPEVKEPEAKKEEEKKTVIDAKSREEEINEYRGYLRLTEILQYLFFWKPKEVTEKNVYKKLNDITKAYQIIIAHNYSPFGQPIISSKIFDFFDQMIRNFVDMPTEVTEGTTSFDTYKNSVVRFIGRFNSVIESWKPAIYIEEIRKLFELYISQNPIADPAFKLPEGQKITPIWVKNTFKFAAIMFFNGYKLKGVRCNDDKIQISPEPKKLSWTIIGNLVSLREGSTREFRLTGRNAEQLVLLLPTWVQKVLVPSIRDLLKSLEEVPAKSLKIAETLRELLNGKYLVPYSKLSKEDFRTFQRNMLSFIRSVMTAPAGGTRPFEMCPAIINLGPATGKLLSDLEFLIRYRLQLKASGVIQDMATNKVRFLSSMLQKEQQKRADDRQVNHAIALWRQHKAKRFLDAARDRDYPI